MIYQKFKILTSKRILDVNPAINKTDVSFYIKTIDKLDGSKVSKAGAYDKGSNPVYVSGVYIKTSYLESVSNIVEETFNYVAKGESKLLKTIEGKKTMTFIKPKVE